MGGGETAFSLTPLFQWKNSIVWRLDGIDVSAVKRPSGYLRRRTFDIGIASGIWAFARFPLAWQIVNPANYHISD